MRAIVTPDEEVRASVVERQRAAGAQVVDGFDLPDSPWDLAGQQVVCTGSVGALSVEAVLLAAVRGVDLVITIEELDSDDRAALLDQLGRVGIVVREERSAPGLDNEQIALLERLAAGDSVREAAERTFMSLRTANRRLAAARRVLAVGSNREAVMTYLKARGS